jgi:hypothetical protein
MGRYPAQAVDFGASTWFRRRLGKYFARPDGFSSASAIAVGVGVEFEFEFEFDAAASGAGSAARFTGR